MNLYFVYFLLSEIALIPYTLQHASHFHARADACAVGADSARFDCFPDPEPNARDCLRRGCCWRQPQSQLKNVPFCFFPLNFPTYTVTNSTVNGSVITASLYNPSGSFRPAMIHNLTMQYIKYTNGVHRLRIFDPLNKRYEVPIPLFNGAAPTVALSCQSILTRRGVTVHSEAGTLLDSVSSVPLIFNDQFIQFSTALFGSFVYGIGEVVAPFQKNVSSFQRYTLWSRDKPPEAGANLYSVHPFALVLRENGSAYGLLLLNSNAMDIEITPYPALTFRTIGGIIDLFAFEGPSPADVLAQYHSLIARPAMPSYWALGYHQCRWGYRNESDFLSVVQRTLDGGFPYDTQWIDGDHMRDELQFTVNNSTYPHLKQIVDKLHSINMHFVPIVDPAISNTQAAGSYRPYDDGHEMNVFIKAYDGKELSGKVWPAGTTTWPDFTHPNASSYWRKQAAGFHQLVAYDGYWTDMNEPSNFVDGSVEGCPKTALDYPPYVPNVLGRSLWQFTLCPSASQALSTHYNLHSLYGYFESKVTYEALLGVMPNKRPFILSRSTFVGSSQFAAHWTGDVSSSWSDMRYSVAQVLNFNLFGIPLVGADICGFMHDTTEELCTRWMQLGSFYPFMRNHNDEDNIAQDPGSFSKEAQANMRAAMFSRYELLPYLYTLFFRATVNGSVVAKPMFVAFQLDKATYAIDDQFLWGDALMISPVLDQGAVTRSVYFPNATWYYGNGTKVNVRGARIEQDAPLSSIPLHVRGGHIIPCQLPSTTTEASRQNSLFLIVAFDELTKSAIGELYLDDGVTLGSFETGAYSLVSFSASENSLSSVVQHGGYRPAKYSTTLTALYILGVEKQPTRVTVNGVTVKSIQFSDQVLTVTSFEADLLKPLLVAWT